MINLSKYLLEARSKQDAENIKILNKFLRGKNYDDYVEIIDTMLKDPKTRKLLIDGFGGKYGNIRFKYSVEEIVAKTLIPTQSELDLDKSIKYAVQIPDVCKNAFEEPVIVNGKPIITFNKKYIIDGHHSWFQIVGMNPNAKMMCFNFNGKLEPIEMLKAVQGVIAAVKAENDDRENKLKHSVIGHYNVFEMTKQEIYDYVKKTISKECRPVLCEYLRVANDENVAKVISDNYRAAMKNNKPISGAPSRKNMPQVWDGGTREDDEESAEPRETGSAMNKLKNKKVIKTVVQ